MALRLLIDVSVGYLVEEWLLDEGYDIVAIRDIDRSMPDDVILSKAAADNRLVITMDKDFGEMVFHSGLVHAGVLLLRLEVDTSVEKIAASLVSSMTLVKKSRGILVSIRESGFASGEPKREPA